MTNRTCASPTGSRPGTGSGRCAPPTVAAVAETVAGMALPVAMMAKKAVGRAFETTLAEGVRFERRLFHAVFATADQKEGRAALVDKRPPEFRHR